MALARRAAKGVKIQPPDSVKLSTKRHRLLWEEYTSSRLPSDWRVSDLVLVGKLITAQLEEERLRRRLKSEGETFVTEKGDVKPHPLCAEARARGKEVLVIMKMLGLFVKPSSSVMANAAPKVSDLSDDKPASLIRVA